LIPTTWRRMRDLRDYGIRRLVSPRGRASGGSRTLQR
jgi:hypothetical protein